MEQYKPVLEGMYFIYFCLIVAITGLFGWTIFWLVLRKEGNVRELFSEGSFLENLTVVGIVIATTSLGAIGVLSGQVCGAIISGIAGYVLGSKSRAK